MMGENKFREREYPVRITSIFFEIDEGSGLRTETGSANYIRADIVKELLEALEASRKAINTLDEDALGMVTREDGHGGIDYWPFKVELLHQIDTAIAKAKGVPDARETDAH